MILHSPDFDSIPDDLRSRPQWVCWRMEAQDGDDKLTKIPYDARTGRKAKANDPATWHPFEVARAAFHRSQKSDSPYSGVGIELTADHSLCGVDLDHCIDPDTGEIAEWALAIVSELDTYTAYSPSGTGLRLFAFGSLPAGGRKKGPIEVYDSARFLTVTGRHFGSTPMTVNERSGALAALHARIFPPKPAADRLQRPQTPLSLPDHELIEKAAQATNGAKFERLWRGDTSGHNSRSEADMALCGLLAFWTQGDHGRIDSLFRQSDLMRAKWDVKHHGDGRTYGEGTIDAALTGKTEFYNPRPVPTLARRSAPGGMPRNIAVGGATPAGRPAVPAASPGDAWDAPVPIGAQRLPSFPMEALPPVMADFISEVAASSQVPLDMAAMLALTVVATAGARRARVQIGSTHSEPLNLYVAVVMEPGSRKSSTLESFAAPLREFERRLVAEKTPAILMARERQEQQKRRISVLRDLAAKEKREIERKALEDELLPLAADQEEVPGVPRLLADDVTMERLAGILAEQEDNCLAILTAEGGLFGILAGRYASGAVNLDLMLKAHSSETVLVDRQNQPARNIPKPTLTIGLAVQPDVLQSLAEKREFRGRGLLGRFLYCLPENLVGTRKYLDRGVAADAKDRYHCLIARLLSLPALSSPGDPGKRHTLLLTGPALDIWKTYHDAVELAQAEGGALVGVRDWASKLAGAVARIAGNLHLVKHAEKPAPWTLPIEQETVAAAWAIGEYLIPHAQAAFSQIGANPAAALAQRILRWISREQKASFSNRDCHRVYQSVASAVEVADALLLLAEHGFVRLEEQERTGPGRKPSPLYAVNPAILQGEK